MDGQEEKWSLKPQTRRSQSCCNWIRNNEGGEGERDRDQTTTDSKGSRVFFRKRIPHPRKAAGKTKGTRSDATRRDVVRRDGAPKVESRKRGCGGSRREENGRTTKRRHARRVYRLLTRCLEPQTEYRERERER